MDEQTTTDLILPGAGADEPAQPAPADEAAAPQATEPTNDQPDEPAEPSPPVDDNLAWLQKKGIDPSSPEAVSKLAEMYRNAEKQMHESTAKASGLQKSLNTPPEDQQPGEQGQDEEKEVIGQLASEVQQLKQQQ